MIAPASPDQRIPTLEPGAGPRPERPACRAARRPVRPLVLMALLAVTFGAGIALGRGAGSEAVAAAQATVPAEAPADFDVYWEALRLVREQFVDTAKLDDQNLTWGSIRGMVEALGDTGHSTFLTPDDVQAEQDSLDGRVSGIGVIIDQRDGIPVVVSVFDGSPADRAGIRPGDILLAVDGQRTDRLSPDEIVRLVRGPKGTTVVLRVRHHGGVTESLSIIRDEIVVPSVSWALVPGTRIADVRVVQFSTGVGAGVRAAVREALDGRARGLILDLRGNPGGLVDEAIDVASAFLGAGVLYREQDRDGKITPVEARGDAVADDTPMLVLVDGGSASAAEIVTAALQQNGRARVVGEPTYGTGTVLNEFMLADGSALRLGVIAWLTPDGDRVFESGITPDVVVALPPAGFTLGPTELDGQTARQFASSGDRQLKRATRLLSKAR